MNKDREARTREKAREIRKKAHNEWALGLSMPPGTPYKAAIVNTAERLRSAPFYQWAEILHQFAEHAASLECGEEFTVSEKLPEIDRNQA